MKIKTKYFIFTFVKLVSQSNIEKLDLLRIVFENKKIERQDIVDRVGPLEADSNKKNSANPARKYRKTANKRSNFCSLNHFLAIEYKDIRNAEEEITPIDIGFIDSKPNLP